MRTIISYLWLFFSTFRCIISTTENEIEATCTVPGNVVDNDNDYLQKIFCGILADTTEDLEGVPFFIESSAFNSTTNAFPITIYYKSSEKCADDACKTFISNNLKDIKLESGATCTVTPPDFKSNLVSVAATDFVTTDIRDACPTNNYEFDCSISRYNVRNPNRRLQISSLLPKLISNTFAENPTLSAFYVDVNEFDKSLMVYNAKLYCKGTNKIDECLGEFKNIFEVTRITNKQRGNFVIDQKSPGEPGISITLKKWSEVVTKRDQSFTACEKHARKIAFIDATNVTESYRDILQKEMCRKLGTKHGTEFFYIKVGDFNKNKKEFDATLYLKYDKDTGIVECGNESCTHFYTNNFLNQRLTTANGTSLTFSAQSTGEKKTSVQVKEWIEVESWKQKCSTE
ncbi:hypothetical protein GJ496_002279 [Pomphorhynchus laevis]|nr:hypothetical protein GJ496_002279 [Pomphorhynchus laevis]